MLTKKRIYGYFLGFLILAVAIAFLIPGNRFLGGDSSGKSLASLKDSNGEENLITGALGTGVERRQVSGGQEEKGGAGHGKNGWIHVQSAGGLTLNRLALETKRGIVWLDSEEGNFNPGIYKNAMRVKAPGHHWKPLTSVKDGKIILEPINFFVLAGPDVAEKVRGMSLSDSLDEHYDLTDFFLSGSTLDGSWAVAMDIPWFDPNQPWVNFNVELRNGWMLSIHLDDAIGKKVVIPFSSLGIHGEKIKKVSIGVLGLNGHSMESGLTVKVWRWSYAVADSFRYLWGKLSIQRPQYAKDLPLLGSRVLADLPSVPECYAAVLDSEKNVYGGIQFFNDGTPQLIQLKSGRHFHGTIETFPPSELPDEIKLGFDSNDSGWEPSGGNGSPIETRVSPNGEFEFDAIPLNKFAAIKPASSSMQIRINANKFKTTRIEIQNAIGHDVDLGKIVLQERTPLVFVRDEEGLDPKEFISASLVAVKEGLDFVTIRYAEEMPDGNIALYCSEAPGISSIEDEQIAIAPLGGQGEVFTRVGPSQYERVFSSREYSVHLVFSREFEKQEILQIGWTFTKPGVVVWLGNIGQVKNKSGELRFRFNAPPENVFLSLKLLKNFQEPPIASKLIPFAGDKLLVTFP